MKFETIAQYLEGIPYISSTKAKVLYNFILKSKPQRILELGFAHGTSSCYIAAALEELGKGELTTVDLKSTANSFSPSIDELLAKTGLAKYVSVNRENTSYTWFLKKKIEEQTKNKNCTPLYDFCFIDGAKNWTIDSCAFFLVDKLLKENGTILFDDYNWSYAEQEKLTGKTISDGINHLSLGEDELNTPHINLIFHLLVMQHPNYSQFTIQDDYWAWATKIKSDSKIINLETNVNFKAKIVQTLKKFLKKVKT